MVPSMRSRAERNEQRAGGAGEQDEEALERKYAAATYEAAAAAVMEVLWVLAGCGGYTPVELGPPAAIARLAARHLPACAVTFPRHMRCQLDQVILQQSGCLNSAGLTKPPWTSAALRRAMQGLGRRVLLHPPHHLPSQLQCAAAAACA